MKKIVKKYGEEELNEDEIIERAKNGDEYAFAKLYEMYKSKVLGFLCERVKNSEEAEDLLQETFLKLHKNFHYYDSRRGKFSNILLALADNVFKDYYRSTDCNGEKTIEDLFDFIELPMHEDISDTVMMNDYAKYLNMLIDNLNERQNMVVRLVYIKDKSYRDAAKIMNLSETQVRDTLHRAKVSLRKQMIEKYPEVEQYIKKSTTKHLLKMIIMTAVCITAISGFLYATYKIYNEFFAKETYTLSEMREEVSEAESIISKEEALDNINYYLEVLGEEKANIEEIKLIRNFEMTDIHWLFKKESEYYIEIDSITGKICVYNNFNGNDILNNMSIHELLEELKLPTDYEIYDEQCIESSKEIIYAKKYGEIFNKFESIDISIINNKIIAIKVLDNPCENTEILISKEKALEIAKENGIDVEEIKLDFMDLTTKKIDGSENTYEELILDNISERVVEKRKRDIKKVWAIKTDDRFKYTIDCITGKLFAVEKFTIEEKKSN